MKKITFILFALIAGTTFAQNSATAADVSAAARIVQPLTVSATGEQLNFGQIASTNAGGTVILKPDGTIDNTSDADYITETTSTLAVPTFTVGGEALSAYTITLPSSDVTLTKMGSTETMIVNAFTASYTDKKSSLDDTGADDFTVGATLNVGANQVVGSYTGTFDVTVTYN